MPLRKAAEEVTQLLFTKTMSSAREEIDRMGGRVMQVFNGHVLVAKTPASAAPLQQSTNIIPDDLDPMSKTFAQAWKQSQDTKNKEAEEAPIIWDSPGLLAPGKLD